MDKIIEVALSQYGTKEIVGEDDNQTIVNYAKEAGFDWVEDDETAWCSIFMNWCAMKANKPHTGKANARSWLDIGEDVKVPRIGDIVVFKRGSSSWQGHVALYVNEDEDFVYVLGGNQSNSVNISPYRKSRLLGYRRL